MFVESGKVTEQKGDSLSPVNSQLEVRDADVVLTAIKLYLGLRKKKKNGQR